MCITCKSGERVRQFDMFGAPIGVTYNAQPEFKTGLGGCITITLLIYFISNFFLNVVAVLFRNEYTFNQVDSFSSFLEMSPPDVMSTQNQTMFTSIMLESSSGTSLPSGYSNSDFFRVMYYSRTGSDGQDTITWHNTILCKDMYKDMIDADISDFATEFGSAEWVCPNVPEMSV